MAGAAALAAVLAPGGSPSVGDGSEVDRVALPDPGGPGAAAEGASGTPVVAPSPFVASPSATVLCSDLAEHRVKLAWLDEPEIGDAVDLHGTPCIVTEIDGGAGDGADTDGARPRFDFPRGIARGNRPGTGPTPGG